MTSYYATLIFFQNETSFGLITLQRSANWGMGEGVLWSSRGSVGKCAAFGARGPRFDPQ